MDLVLRVGADIDKFRSELNKVNSTLNGFSSNLKGIGVSIAAAFTVDKIIDVGRQMINVTAEFQKFEAVLQNTLGSNSQAAVALTMIEEFAARTPYSVQELTGSFVKLANQGFVPTQKELMKLGDLASAMGKNFDQLTEAIIDAQTGEFERLKEFGIRASKEGDRVTFTFKGVQTQTEFTSQAIRDYILSLGDLEGVSGGMIKVSQTLGGQISNLGDSWDKLLKVLGSRSSGIISKNVEFLQALLSGTADLLKSSDQILQDRINSAVGSELENFKKLSQELGNVSVAEDKAITNLKKKYAELQVQIARNNETATFVAAQKEKDLKNEQTIIEAQINAIRELSKQEKERVKAANDKALATQKELAYKNMLAEVEARLERFSQRARLVDGRVQKFEDTKIGQVDTSGLTNMATALEGINARIQPVVLSMQTSLQNLQNYVMVDFAPAIANSFLNLGIGIGEAFGNMASGIGGFEQLASAALGALGAMLGQFGQLAIQAGITKIALDQALVKFGGGAGAVAAGIALVALSKMVSNKAASIARGGGSSGSVSSRGASALEGRAVDYAPGQRIVIGGEFKVDGKNLVAAINNQSRFDGRTKS